MDTMNNWALWRTLLIGLVVLPFLIAAVVASFRRSDVEGLISDAQRVDRSASSEGSGPSAWGGKVDAPEEGRFVGAVPVERRAA